jgi:drug/metabolite transporter (DMT)-like permease
MNEGTINVIISAIIGIALGIAIVCFIGAKRLEVMRRADNAWAFMVVLVALLVMADNFLALRFSAGATTMLCFLAGSIAPLPFTAKS